MLIALDSNVLIAALSPHEAHSLKAERLIKDIAKGKHSAVVSSLVYGEVLSVSTSRGAIDLEDFILHIKNLKTIAANDNICLESGNLRLQYGSKLKLPDAVHLVTALQNKADVFLTNDKVLAKTTQKLIPTKLLSEWS